MGVRQCGGTSCSLFIFFFDCIVEAVAASETSWVDRELPHSDTDVRLGHCCNKPSDETPAPKQCSDNLGQPLQPVKSKFFTVNWNDKIPIVLDNVTDGVSYTEIDIYLGTPMSNAPLHKQGHNHISNKHNHCMKFTSFLYRNCNAPNHVRESVWQSVPRSALFYSCETWLFNDLCAADVL